MNEKKENNNLINIEESKNQKIISQNGNNKKIFNKNSIRKQKRLFQMQKRLALFNEDEFSELESNKVDDPNDIINNLKSFQKFIENNQNILKDNKNSISLNYSSSHNDDLNEEKTHLEKENALIIKENIIGEKAELKNEENEELNKNLDNVNINNKEEELSIKKKNTNPNTNDEDKSSSEILLYNEFEQNKKKSINQNDSIDAIAFTKIINDDIYENVNINIFSKNNENKNTNENKEEKEEKEEKEKEKEDNLDKFNSKDFISVHLTNNENIINNLNNFDFYNIINDNNNDNNNNMEIKSDENEKNNSVIINEDEDNNKNENNNNDDNNNNNEEENVELNISNLEIDINQINNDSNYIQNEDELAMSGENSNEFAKKYLSSKSKSFIKFNNNLTARVAAHNLKNSPSYMLALCPELLENYDKKNIICDNYAVTDAISEEMESDTFTPRQSEKIDYSINKNTIDNNKSINTNDYQINNTLRNKEINNTHFDFLFDTKENKEQITPKCFNKNKNKINKNRIKEIKDIDIELKNLSNSQKKKINTKSLSTSINSNNCIFNTNNKSNINHNEVQGQTHIKNGILKNSDKKINDNLKIKFKHQKAKSLINNSQINSLYLNGNIKNNNSPKQVSFKLFDKDNSINKGILKNNGYKNLYNKEKEKKYFSNENYINNNSQSNKKNYKKNNSNAMKIKNLKLCKSDKRIKENANIKFGYLKKTNAQIISRSNPYKYNKNNLYNEKNKKICYTEKTNKSKNYITFISHMKKNTPININNINNMTEQNINHSKKLSQQIYDGYKFFMNSLNYNNNNNRVKEINKIKIGLNNLNIKKSTPLSNYFSFNKNKIYNIKKNNNNNYNNSNNITFIKKNSVHKDNKDNKMSHIIPNHNKSKTTFISPSYQNMNKNKLFNNFSLGITHKGFSSKNNDKYNKNIQKYLKKNKYNTKFNEIKKILNDSSVKIIHKKINTIGNSNDLTKLLNKNLNNGISINKQLKGSASNYNLKKNFNKHKIIMALQHIKFLPNENYSKALNELYKSKKNLFIILVYTDSIKRYIFRGLYEVNSTDQKTANKLFAPGYGQNIININSLNSFFNYQSNNGEFVKTKFNNDNDKKFGADTIIVY